MNIADYVCESNAIEGIYRTPTLEEIEATASFVSLELLSQSDLVSLVSVFQPNARFRDRSGLNVRVGSHFPLPGGVQISVRLAEILELTQNGGHPYIVHQKYETLHPFTDGNGRSGRALWLWGMKRLSEVKYEQALELGFLHTWYYQSLEFSRYRD